MEKKMRNLAIAKFLNWQCINEKTGEEPIFISNNKRIPAASDSVLSLDIMLFDSSWDWLMPLTRLFLDEVQEIKPDIAFFVFEALNSFDMKKLHAVIGDALIDKYHIK